MKKISIITVTRDRKDLLLETIDSVQKSILKPLNIEWEHIIYDDGSKDGTPDLFEKQAFKNTKYIYAPHSNGPSYGRNRAIEAASGDYLIMIDSDDILLQRTLHGFTEAAIASPDISWFVSDFLHVDQDLRYMPGEDYYAWNFSTKEAFFEAVFKGEHFIQSNVFFKKSLFEKVKGFDESMHMAEDLDLYIRFAIECGLPAICKLQSHLHRFHGSNLSSSQTDSVHKEIALMLKNKYKGIL